MARRKYLKTVFLITSKNSVSSVQRYKNFIHTACTGGIIFCRFKYDLTKAAEFESNYPITFTECLYAYK